jgi:hypothetical protein
VPKQRWRGKTTSAWEEPDEENDPAFDCIFQTRTGNSIRKSLPHAFPTPNPNFHCQYDATKDAKELLANLVLGQVKIPIRGYEMVIDTGNHKAIAVRNYGLHEIPIMQKTIDKLLEMMFIRRDMTSTWASQITLAPKPHQEAVMDINEYIWRFCINYIQVNIVTRPAEYPVPRCNDAVMYGFGEATFLSYLMPIQDIIKSNYLKHQRLNRHSFPPMEESIVGSLCLLVFPTALSYSLP